VEEGNIKMMKTFSWPACVQNNSRQHRAEHRGSTLKEYRQGRRGPKMDKIVFLAIRLSKLSFEGKLKDFLLNPALGYLLCKQRVTLPG
jgi:hypothetical protein